MTEKESEIQLPSSEEILAAYYKLFGQDKSGIKRYKKSGVHYVDLPHNLVLLEQNPDKESHWAIRLARGAKLPG